MSFSDLDEYLFPFETNSLDDSLYVEPLLPFSVETTMTNHMEPQIPTSFIEASNLMYPPLLHSTDEQMATSHMPTPLSTVASFDAIGCSSWINPIDQLSTCQEDHQEWNFLGQDIPTPPSSNLQGVAAAAARDQKRDNFSEQIFLPKPNEEQRHPPEKKQPLLGYTPSDRHLSRSHPVANEETLGQLSGAGVKLEIKMPIDMDLTKLSSNLTSASKELKGHDPEALKYFLAGTVRPGPDVTHIYKCEVCYMEFPNAQAFGGHMSSHSKKREKKLIGEKGSMSKKRKHRCTRKTYKSTINVKERKHDVEE